MINRNVVQSGDELRGFESTAEAPWFATEARSVRRHRGRLRRDTGDVEMNWEAIGAVGEVAGAIGVIATLLYLAAQIRQNTRAMRGATQDAIDERKQYELRWSSDIAVA